MTARPIDGAEGYRFFLQHEGHVGLEEINHYLREIGLREVRPRMLSHYRKLLRHGFGGYVTQNRLDLAVAGNSGWIEELQARYSELTQAEEAEVWWDDGVAIATVESVGLASATIEVQPVPPPNAPVVFRLRASGRATTATVIRSDSDSGRAHLQFDVYGGIAVAPQDSPYAMQVQVEIPDGAETMPAISDLLFRIERTVGRAQGLVDELPRVQSIKMASPLELVLVAAEPLNVALGVLLAAPLLRKHWYQGRKAKLEAEGVELDNEAKRRALQLEVDQDLKSQLEKAVDGEDDDDEAIQFLRQNGAEEAFQRLSRREFLGAIVAALTLPLGLTAETPNDDQNGGS